DHRARARVARAERLAVVGAGDGRGAQPRPGRRRLAAAARARGRGRVVDLVDACRADARVTIVSDVKERGLDAVREWAVRLDGVEPARAVPDGELPEEAVLALADRVR